MPRKERPLDAGDSTLVEFAEGLRELRARAGLPPYRTLSARAHYSAAALSEAASGRKLPSLGLTLAYVGACGGDVEEWERRWHDIAAEQAGRQPPQDGGDPPYRGLAAFQREDAHHFYGRDRLVGQLCDRLSRHRFVAVFGASGSGKSSLLRAGLLARLDSAVLLTPGPFPVEEYRRVLADGGDRERVVVVDQFEEVFTLCRDQAQRDRFIELLVGACRAEHGGHRVVIGVRADFFAHCTAYPELVEELRDGQLTVGPMTAVELQRAITQPAVNAGCTVEGALQAAIVAEAAGRPGVLPLLSHALLETWHRRRGNALTLAAFQAAGGLTGALAQTAESVHDALPPHQRDLLKNLFLRLTASDEEAGDTKRRVAWDELDDHADLTAVLRRLTENRLLTVDREGVEIAHEALIQRWPRLRQWLAEDREGRRLHRHLTEATDAWEALGGDAGALYRGTRLALTLDWAAGNPAALTRREQRFLHASRSAELRGHRRLRRLVALLGVLFLLAVAATAFAVRTGATAAAQRNAALAQIAAGEAVARYPDDPDLAVQLALAAHRQAPTDHTRDSLLSTLPLAVVGHSNEVLSTVFAPDGRTMATAGFDRAVRLWDVTDPRRPTELATLTGHDEGIYGTAISQDGRTLATASTDRTARLWDITDPRRAVQIAVLQHAEAVYSVSFSAEGGTLAVSGFDHTVRLWGVEDPRSPVELAVLAHAEAVNVVEFSPDGRTLASGGMDRAVRLWDVRDPRRPVELTTLTEHTDGMHALAFSPDGRTLASGGDDHTARLWDVTDPRRPTRLAVLTGHVDGIYALAFSPDGRTLASGSDDRAVRLWNVADPRGPVGVATLSGHTDAVSELVFSPDGRVVATASWDNTVRLLTTDFSRAIAHACERVREPLTRAEWERHFPGLDHRPPCAG
ncbi:WD40 repeat domain-containing protein [Saccharothrix coeruleofusca]|uniref:HTH cro/C1-type domain-containing protein n=1 Tax=Saccharothrix coeruleofusca TaxID=33919 RepID=A0A918APQ1_9PSEU|nr:WD40 repeat domain-containing protein [Saccharothrix coeruleofusca]GGP67278.1 hypothetical protein GCM10010185_45180 [Saccharothrix coeruleofusca]